MATYNIQNLKVNPPKWNHTPTKAIRIPEVFEQEILAFARQLDQGQRSLSETEGRSPQPQKLTQADLTTWSIEELLNLQSVAAFYVPEILQTKRRELAANRPLEKCILYLAKRCDGAFAEDGQGFSGADTGYGHWLARQIQSAGLSQVHAQSGLKMIQKYRKQLERGGLDLPQWEDIKDSYPTEIQHTDQGDDLPEKRVELKGDKIAVSHPYDPSGKLQALSKSIEGWDYNGQKRVWYYPLSAIEKVLATFPEGYAIAPDLEGVLLAQKAAESEAKANEESHALQVASEIEQLIAHAQLDKPLSNGWILRDYQKQGVQWLLAHRKGGIYGGGILADQMGLGKTLTAMVAARGMLKAGVVQHLFVCCPVSLQETWTRAAELVEVPVEVFSNDYRKIPAPLEMANYLLIVDEAHSFQEEKSRRTQKFLALAQSNRCKAAWLLTGTPIKNGRPINLLPLLMAIGHPLVQDKWVYLRRYCNAHQKDVGKRTVWDFTGAAFLSELSAKTEDAMLRRTKAQVLTELPAKTRLYKAAELEPNQEKAYWAEIDAQVKDYRDRAQRGEVAEEAEALVRLNILRKIGSQYKINAAIEYAEELLSNGQQVVLFTEFLESAKALHQHLGGELLIGEVKPTDRQSIVDRFQSGQSKVFVGTIKAGGVGLTLTAASNILLVDRPWTPGDAEQAEDRCHRIGQNNAVFATWLQLGIIDQSIDNLLESKQQRIELVLKGKRKTLRGVGSAKELAKELLDILASR